MEREGGEEEKEGERERERNTYILINSYRTIIY